MKSILQELRMVIFPKMDDRFSFSPRFPKAALSIACQKQKPRYRGATSASVRRERDTVRTFSLRI
jgi:hypothetical protein